MGKNRINEELADLRAFVDSTMLEDIIGVVKSGKEATVYCCQAGEPLGGGLVAAKVYRARMVRQFANASTYNAGRHRQPFKREARAMLTKTRFGQELAFGKWVADEWETLQLLHRAGVSVPAPLTISAAANHRVGRALRPTMRTPIAEPIAMPTMNAAAMMANAYVVGPMIEAINRVHVTSKTSAPNPEIAAAPAASPGEATGGDDAARPDLR